MVGFAQNRSHPIRKYVTLNPSQLDELNLRLAMSGNPKFTTYARRSLLAKEIVNINLMDSRRLINETARIGNNINQIARRVNENQTVETQDVSALKEHVHELFLAFNDELLHRLDLVEKYEQEVLHGDHEDSCDH